MSRQQHNPRFAVDGLSLRDFDVAKVSVKDELIETTSKSCHGDGSRNVEGCSETRTTVRHKTMNTVYKSVEQLRVVRPVDRLPLVFESREQALLEALTSLERRYRQKGNQRVKANLTAAQLKKLLDRFK